MVKSNRCIVLANGFYEWNRNENPKQPYRITIKDCQNMAMVGIYQVNRDGEIQCCIITMQANQKMSRGHHRMPVMIEKENLKKWIDADDPQVVESIYQFGSDVEVELYKVSSYVNSAKNQGKQCIETV